MLKEEFIKRARRIHSDKYNYNLIPEEFSTKHKVQIKCNRCGRIFEQRSGNHLLGRGCKKCMNLISQEEFLKRAKEIHGNKYDYSETNIYNKINNKVKIYCKKCKKHFWQSINVHIQQKCGCPKCGTEKTASRTRLTTIKFIKKAQKIHGTKHYDYSKVRYGKNNHTKVLIHCNVCNKDFWQKPYSHLAGKGCLQCGNNSNKLTQKEFIERSKEIHGDKYDYSKIEYEHCETKVLIHCNICNKDFEQTPHIHLSGKGCPYCAGVKKLTQDEFIKRAKVVHGDIYDYSLIEYKGLNKKVKIICKKCNRIFWQNAQAHLLGKGCRCISESKGERLIIKLLKNKGIAFIFQKRFNNCKDRNPLPFDFYLPDYKVVIEFQGKQHYEEGFDFYMFIANNNLKQAKLLFEKQKYHDQIKHDYCKNNNIKFYEILYNENTEIRLNEILLELEK